MINPYLACELRRASRFFAKVGQPWLSRACHTTLGNMADTTKPDETEAQRLIHLAFGGTRIHA